jgi:RNA recognition motif-containing protein
MDGRKLFVANIAADVTVNELKEQFSYFGGVQFVRIIQERGIAFVKMFRLEDAEQARTGLNGVSLKGRSIRVMEARSRS